MNNRRNVELVLLIFAWALGILGTLQVGWATGEGTPPRLWITTGAVALIALAMHLVVRFRATYADPIMLPVGTLLTILGLIMIYRLDVADARRAELNGAPIPTPDVYSQLTWFAIAGILFCGVLILLRDHRRLQRYTFTFGLLGLFLMVLPLAPVIGTTVNGATLWIRIGTFSFQPAEIAKILITIFFAGYLVSRQAQLSEIGSRVLGVRLPRAKDLGPILLFWIASLGVLVIQRDLGTSILYFGLFLVMIYTATGRGFYVGIGIVMMVTGALVASRLFDYVERRFDSWLDPLSQSNYEAVGGSYQLVQGLFGMANGDVIGAGLGGGYPQFIPLAESDFVFAALGEELGLAGVFAILSIFLLIVYRGLRISNSHPDDFSKLLAMGLSFVIALQVFVVAGGVMGMLPLTGLTTPFLAAGGSSLLANWTIIALLLITSHSSLKRPSA